MKETFWFVCGKKFSLFKLFQCYQMPDFTNRWTIDRLPEIVYKIIQTSRSNVFQTWNLFCTFWIRIENVFDFVGCFFFTFRIVIIVNWAFDCRPFYIRWTRNRKIIFGLSIRIRSLRLPHSIRYKLLKLSTTWNRLYFDVVPIRIFVFFLIFDILLRWEKKNSRAGPN